MTSTGFLPYLQAFPVPGLFGLFCRTADYTGEYLLQKVPSMLGEAPAALVLISAIEAVPRPLPKSVKLFSKQYSSFRGGET